MIHVKYIGSTNEQVIYGGHDDPRGLLIEGKTYGLINKRVYAWHTSYELLEHPGKTFNSVCFHET